MFVSGGCQSATATPQEGNPQMALQVTSSAFNEGSPIPRQYTCDGEDLSPPLAWKGVPANTHSLVLIADDPDAPVGTWVHWVLYDIPGSLSNLPQGISKTPTVPGFGTQGTNTSRKGYYNGPCPPRGIPHRYFFKLYALDTSLNLKPGANAADVEKAMRGHILAQGQLMGTYGR